MPPETEAFHKWWVETAITLLIHATAVQWLGKGLILRGTSGIGKSDLAIRLIENGAELVGDDQLDLQCEDGKITARACAPGWIELRHLGLFRLPYVCSAAVDWMIDLSYGEPEERLPPLRFETILGIRVPLVQLNPRHPSATARLRILLTSNRIIQ